MRIRTATLADLSAVTAVETACFPPAEAATKANFENRLTVYPDHFWLLEADDGTIISFINGLVTNQPILCDEMYGDTSFHNEQGAWQMIFGVNTLPEYRRRGLAAQVMERVITDAKAQGRRGCALTCKGELIHYYEKFGFVSEGISASVHGGAVWYDMRLTF